LTKFTFLGLKIFFFLSSGLNCGVHGLYINFCYILQFSRIPIFQFLVFPLSGFSNFPKSSDFLNIDRANGYYDQKCLTSGDDPWVMFAKRAASDVVMCITSYFTMATSVPTCPFARRA
jgi:hypothetical protein